LRLRYIRDTRGTVLPDRARGFPCFFHALLESFREFFAEILVIFEIDEIVSFMRGRSGDRTGSIPRSDRWMRHGLDRDQERECSISIGRF